MDPAGFVNALYGAVLGNSQPAAGGQGGPSSYVTLEWPGLPLDPSQFGNIWASDNQTGSPEALENFSGVVDDDVPALSPLFQPTGISLEQAYGLILQATVTSGPVANSFAAAQATYASVTRGSLQNPAVLFHPSTPVPRTWCDPAGEASWTRVEIGSNTQPPPPPPPVLKSVVMRPELLQWRIATPSAATVPPLPDRAGPIRPALSAMAATSLHAAAVTDHPATSSVIAARTQLADLRAGPVAAPVSTALSAAMLSRLKAMPPGRVPIRIGPAEPPPARPAPRPAPTPAPAPRPVGASGLSATFRYKKVTILRPWIDATLFHLPGWSIAGMEAGAISTGSAESNTGFLPLLPVAFIAVRDVVIRGAWSETDKAAAREAVAGNRMAAFGPLTLPANGSAAAFDGSTLQIPGIQVIAWICQFLPKLPPQ